MTTAYSTEDDPPVASGTYFDGVTARAQAVRIVLNGNLLEIREEGTERRLAEWPLASLRALHRAAARARPLAITVAEDGPLPIGASSKSARPQEQRLVIGVARGGRRLSNTVLARAPKLSEPSATARRLRRTAFIVAAGAVASIGALIFFLVPFLAQVLARVVPVEAEIALGDDVAAIVRSDRRFGRRPCAAPPGVAALAKMTDRLADASDAHVPIRVSVIRSPEINAFALPGGRIFVFSGLIDAAASPEEVAGVLAHEIGHVVGRDSLEAIIRSGVTFAIFSTLGGDFSGAAVGAAIGDAIVSAQFSRSVEAEADDTALEILERAGVPATPVSGFFMNLIERYGDSDNIFSTHPLSSERAAKFRDATDAVGPPILTPKEWTALRAICG